MSIACVGVLLVVALSASACGGDTTTTVTGSATTIQVVTTAASTATTAVPTETSAGALTVEDYRVQMKALWDKFGPVLDTTGDPLGFDNPSSPTAAEVQTTESFVSALRAFVAGLQGISPPAEAAEPHHAYTDIFSRLAVEFDALLTAAKTKDAAALTAAITSIETFFEQEDAAATATTAVLEKILGFSLTGDSSGSSTTPTLSADAKTYTHPTDGYSLQYPAGWVLDDQATVDSAAGSGSTSRVAIFDPQGAAVDDVYINTVAVSIYELSATLTDADIPDIQGEIEAVLADLLSQSPGAEVLSPLALTQVGALKGYVVTLSFYKDGTVPAVSSLYFLFKGDIQYQVTAQAAAEDWDTLQPTFEAIVASFTAP